MKIECKPFQFGIKKVNTFRKTREFLKFEFNSDGQVQNLDTKRIWLLAEIKRSYWDVEAVPSEKVLKIESPNLSVI